MLTQRLTALELDILAAYAVRRFSESMTSSVGGNVSPRTFDRLINSAMSEYVVARYLGVFFDLDNARKSDIYVHDIGCKVEVRHATAPDAHLILSQKDRDDAVFVLVLGTAPEYRIVGFQTGAAIKRAAFWSAEKGGFWLPQHALRPMTELRAAIQQRKAGASVS